MSGLFERVAAWIDDDPDPETSAELQRLLSAAQRGDTSAEADLADRFSGELQFGTAGLRAELGGGPMRMNRVVVRHAAAGLASFLLENRVSTADRAIPDRTIPNRQIIVGYDARRGSEQFARDSAEIFAGAGLDAVLLPRPLPTPVLAFAVRALGAVAGVMVTASHNPPRDNGYKVYLGGPDHGAQIVSPVDAEIARHIAAAGDHPHRIRRSDTFEVADEQIVSDYIRATADVAPARPAASSLTIAYTPMHGVGAETVLAVLQHAGYPAPRIVAEQHAPDPDFPTVTFPNPEEPGALDLVLELGTDIGADIVLANDPDADRLAVAIPSGDRWRVLTGNEVGLLLGWRAAQIASGDEHATLACSLVSSPALETIARQAGIGFTATLTGFKWIARAPGIVYGYEEALGYLVNPETVRDKDGISALVAILDLATTAREHGTDLAGMLERVTAITGHTASGQVTLRVEDLRDITAVMGSLRAAPPASIGPLRVARVDDLSRDTDASPGSDIMRFWLDDGSRVIARPSGTEPKLKVYLDVTGETRDDADSKLAALHEATEALIAERRDGDHAHSAANSHSARRQGLGLLAE